MTYLDEIQVDLLAVEMPENFTNIVELKKVKDILAYSDLLKSEFEQTIRFVNNLKTPHLSAVISYLVKTIGAETSIDITKYDSKLSDEDLNTVIKNANNIINWRMWGVLKDCLNLLELSNFFDLNSLFESKVFSNNNRKKEAINFTAENIAQVFNGINSAFSVSSMVDQVKEFSKYLDFNFMANGNVLIKYDSEKRRETFIYMEKFLNAKAYQLTFILGGLLLSRGGLKNEALYKSISDLTLKEDGAEWVESKYYYSLKLNKEMGDLFKELTGLNKETV